MAPSIRFYVLGLLLSAGLIGLAVARPDWLNAVAVEIMRDSPEAVRYVVLPSCPKNDVFRKRNLARVRVIDRLLAAELDLFEAAACFRFLNQEPPEYPSPPLDMHRGNSEEERICRQVIAYIRYHTHGGRSESELRQTVERLDAELAARLARFGRIELPDR